MHVVIDHDVCTGHGRCYALAPEDFEPDDAGYGVVRHDEVPPEREAAVRRAATNCPEGAVIVTEARVEA